MEETKSVIYPEQKEKMYRLLHMQMEGLLDAENHWLAALSNAAALLKNLMVGQSGFMTNKRYEYEDHYQSRGSDSQREVQSRYSAEKGTPRRLCTVNSHHVRPAMGFRSKPFGRCREG